MEQKSRAAIDHLTDEKRREIQADFFHGLVRSIEEQRGSSLTPNQLTELDETMDEMAERGRRIGRLTTEHETEIE